VRTGTATVLLYPPVRRIRLAILDSVYATHTALCHHYILFFLPSVGTGHGADRSIYCTLCGVKRMHCTQGNAVRNQSWGGVIHYNYWAGPDSRGL
jgi:hypothetical protein